MREIVNDPNTEALDKETSLPHDASEETVYIIIGITLLFISFKSSRIKYQSFKIYFPANIVRS